MPNPKKRPQRQRASKHFRCSAFKHYQLTISKANACHQPRSQETQERRQGSTAVPRDNRARPEETQGTAHAANAPSVSLPLSHQPNPTDNFPARRKRNTAVTPSHPRSETPYAPPERRHLPTQEPTSPATPSTPPSQACYLPPRAS